MEARYLNAIEQSRISDKPLPLEGHRERPRSDLVFALLIGRGVLRRVVNLALQDEATERIGADRYERTGDRQAYRNGTYTIHCRRYRCHQVCRVACDEPIDDVESRPIAQDLLERPAVGPPVFGPQMLNCLELEDSPKGALFGYL